MTITTLDNGFVLVPREDWGAKPRRSTKPMPAQVANVYLHHSVTPVTLGDPCADMRTIEAVLGQRKLLDGYSFAVHPSGVVLEGAGHYVGAHTSGHNSDGYGLVLIGNYDHLSPTLAQLVNAARALNLCRLVGKLPAELGHLNLIDHCDTKATACPGAHLRGTAKDWIRYFMATGA